MSCQSPNDYINLYKLMERNLKYMEEFKDNNQTQTKFKEEVLDDSLKEESNTSNEEYEIFKKFFDIAWQYCDYKDDRDLVKKKLRLYLHELNQTFDEAKVLDRATIVYQLLTRTARDAFNESEQMRKKYLNAIKAITEKKTNKLFLKSSGKEKVFDVVPIERRFDKIGAWEIDRLFNQMKIYLILPIIKYENEVESEQLLEFPTLWRTNEKTVFTIQEKHQNDQKFNELKDIDKCIFKSKETMSLEELIEKELSINDAEQLEKFIKTLKSKSIFSIKNLIDAVSNWDQMVELFPAHHNVLRDSIEKYRESFTNNMTGKFNKKAQSKTEAENLGDWHKVKLFLFYESESLITNTSSITEFGYLDKNALAKGFEEQRNDADFDGGPVLNHIEKQMEQFTVPNRPLRQNSHGMMLYGPPGTGKTKLCSIIINKSGMYGLVPPLASSELNRSLVGETEQLLLAIFHRANYLKYLLCCIAIDEVDALTPKRDEKVGEQKVDILCLLLSLIGGIKDIPNVFVIASTNRLNKIDEAFLRRLENKFYVGRLNSEQRLSMMQKIDNPQVRLETRFRGLFTSIDKNRKRVEMFILLTSNFSGAALKSLRSNFLKYFDMLLLKSDEEVEEINDETIDTVLKLLCVKVANDFQIKIGGYSVPQLFLRVEREERMNLIDSINEKFRNIFFKDQEQMNELSGRVLIDLRSEFHNIQFERIDGSIKEIPLNEQKRFITDLIPILLSFEFVFKVPYFQLIDSSLMLANAAFNENETLELCFEKINEYEQYDNSMLCFDADTLVGVSSESMSESLTYSIQNNRIWQNVILHNFKSQFCMKQNIDLTNSSIQNERYKKHKWFLIVSSSGFLISQLKKLAMFEYCEREIELNIRERICANCNLSYFQADNMDKLEICRYHPQKKLKKIISSTAGDETHVLSFTKEELIDMAARKGNTDIFNDYYYFCCMKKLNESEGCKTSHHKEVKNPKPDTKKTSQSSLVYL